MTPTAVPASPFQPLNFTDVSVNTAMYYLFLAFLFLTLSSAFSLMV